MSGEVGDARKRLTEAGVEELCYCRVLPYRHLLSQHNTPAVPAESAPSGLTADIGCNCGHLPHAGRCFCGCTMHPLAGGTIPLHLNRTLMDALADYATTFATRDTETELDVIAAIETAALAAGYRLANRARPAQEPVSDLAERVAALADRVESEGDIANRPGQMASLYAIADDLRALRSEGSGQ